MATVLTIAGENLIALKQAQGKTLNIDQFVLALIPGMDPNQPIDRAATMPSADKIKYTHTILQDHKGYISPNQVVYSMLLTSDVGNFSFNWVGLYSSEDKTLIAVTHLQELKKFKSDPGARTLGNNLVRNVLLEFTGAKGITNLTIEAQTWQIDFTARLKDIDERERLSNRDIYGAGYFFGDAYLVTNKAGIFSMQAGTAYVEGVRIDLQAEQVINGENLPKSVYLDVCLRPHGSTIKAKATPIYEDKSDYMDESNVAHYITKIADIAADGTVTDCRPQALAEFIASKKYVEESLHTHTHDIKDIRDLDNRLANKADKKHTHTPDECGMIPATTEEVVLGMDNIKYITPSGLQKWGGNYDGTVKLLSTRKTLGTWTITGLTLNKPLIIVVTPVGASPTACSGTISAASGVVGATTNNYYEVYLLMSDSVSGQSNVSLWIPTADTAVFGTVRANGTMHAYQ